MKTDLIFLLYYILLGLCGLFILISLFYLFNRKVLSKISLSLKITTYLSLVSLLLIFTEYYVLRISTSPFVREYDNLILAGIFFVYILFVFFILYVNLYPIKKIQSNTNRLAIGDKRLNNIVEGSKEFDEIQENLINIQRKNLSNEEYKLMLKKEYYKFVPREFYDYLGKNDVFEMTLGESVQKDVTILFIDIRNSYKTSESLSLEENFKFINNYLSIVGESVRNFNGFIDKFLGDGVLAVFISEKDALLCSTQIANKFENINLVSIGMDKIRYGIGMHSGKVVIGIVGEKERLTPTIISDSVNLAYKIESLNKIFQSKILFTKEVLNNIPSDVELNYRYVGLVTIDSIGVSIFENLDSYIGSNKTAYIKSKNMFETAVRNYEEKNYKKARTLFLEVLKINEDDNLAKYYLKRCKIL